MARKKLNDLRPSSKMRQAIDADTIGLFRADPTDTSLAAALGIKTGTARRKVYDALLECDPRGLTDEEIIALTRLSPNTARPRRIELVNRGFVEDSGRRHRTNTGYPAILWRLTNGE